MKIRLTSDEAIALATRIRCLEDNRESSNQTILDEVLTWIDENLPEIVLGGDFILLDGSNLEQSHIDNLKNIFGIETFDSLTLNFDSGTNILSLENDSEILSSVELNSFQQEFNFTWVKYSEASDGTNMTDDPTDKDFIGLSFNNVESEASEDPNDYLWFRVNCCENTPETEVPEPPRFEWLMTNTDGERTLIGIKPDESEDPTKSWSKDGIRQYYPSGRIMSYIGYVPYLYIDKSRFIQDAGAIVFFKDLDGSPVHFVVDSISMDGIQYPTVDDLFMEELNLIRIENEIIGGLSESNKGSNSVLAQFIEVTSESQGNIDGGIGGGNGGLEGGDLPPITELPNTITICKTVMTGSSEVYRFFGGEHSVQKEGYKQINLSTSELWIEDGYYIKAGNILGFVPNSPGSLKGDAYLSIMEIRDGQLIHTKSYTVEV